MLEAMTVQDLDALLLGRRQGVRVLSELESVILLSARFLEVRVVHHVPAFVEQNTVEKTYAVSLTDGDAGVGSSLGLEEAAALHER